MYLQVYSMLHVSTNVQHATCIFKCTAGYMYLQMYSMLHVSLNVQQATCIYKAFWLFFKKLVIKLLIYKYCILFKFVISNFTIFHPKIKIKHLHMDKFFSLFFLHIFTARIKIMHSVLKTNV